MPGSIPANITLKSGANKVTVRATPVKGRPNVLRTGKLVMIEHGDPFRASDITTIEAGPQNDGANLLWNFKSMTELSLDNALGATS